MANTKKLNEKWESRSYGDANPSAFPPPPPSVPKLNIGCGLDIKPKADGWINSDAFVKDPNIVKHDLTKTPWPFADGQFEYIYASHVMEHIPLMYPEHNGVHRDILFDIMEEAHRVLTVGGKFHIRVPIGGSPEGFGHPQHYRQWTLGWFHFFDPRFPENQYSAARFVVDGWARNKLGLVGDGRLLIRGHPLTQHLKTRLPFLKGMLTARNELEIILKKV